MNYCLSTKWKAVYSFGKTLKNIWSLRNVLSRSAPFWMGFQWCIHMEILVEGGICDGSCSEALGPLSPAGLLASLCQGLPCPGAPLPWGRPEPAPSACSASAAAVGSCSAEPGCPSPHQVAVTGSARQPACVHIWACLLGFWPIIGYKGFLPFFHKDSVNP